MYSVEIRPRGGGGGGGFPAAEGGVSAIRMAVHGPRHRKARSAPFLPCAGPRVKDSADPVPWGHLPAAIGMAQRDAGAVFSGYTVSS